MPQIASTIQKQERTSALGWPVQPPSNAQLAYVTRASAGSPSQVWWSSLLFSSLSSRWWLLLALHTWHVMRGASGERKRSNVTVSGKCIKKIGLYSTARRRYLRARCLRMIKCQLLIRWTGASRRCAWTLASAMVNPSTMMSRFSNLIGRNNVQ